MLQLRLLGLKTEMPGIRVLEKMIIGELTTSDLDKNQIKQVLDVWDTRHFVPEYKLERVDVVKPIITKVEIQQGLYTQDEYDKNYVEMIERYLKTLW